MKEKEENDLTHPFIHQNKNFNCQKKKRTMEYCVFQTKVFGVVNAILLTYKIIKWTHCIKASHFHLRGKIIFIYKCFIKYEHE